MMYRGSRVLVAQNEGTEGQNEMQTVPQMQTTPIWNTQRCNLFSTIRKKRALHIEL